MSDVLQATRAKIEEARQLEEKQQREAKGAYVQLIRDTVAGKEISPDVVLATTKAAGFEFAEFHAHVTREERRARMQRKVAGQSELAVKYHELQERKLLHAHSFNEFQRKHEEESQAIAREESSLRTESQYIAQAETELASMPAIGERERVLKRDPNSPFGMI